ncbi:MAG: hypothetical protein P9M07_05885 [Candidatus Aceula meridiana]|nr:hypothetical protein [Candidatus Aceula meridiana]
MKKLLIVLMCLSFVGCARGQRYKGWEHVRIQKETPNDNCDYKLQEACRDTVPGCYQWYKKRATMFDANTVVITEASEESMAVSYKLFFRADMVSTMMADYYYCPQDKISND